jgi:hypothetical protein
MPWEKENTKSTTAMPVQREGNRRMECSKEYPLGPLTATAVAGLKYAPTMDA